MNLYDSRKETDGKRALVLPGAGNKITLQFGAFEEFLKCHPNYDPDIISCCSAGSLMGSFLAMAPRNGSHSIELRMIELEKILFNLNTKSVWRKRFPIIGWILGFFQKGVRDTKPLNSLIEKIVDPQKIRDSGRRFYVAAYHLNKRKYVEADETSPFLVEFIKASPAFPIFFPPVAIPPKSHADYNKKNPQLYRDGGVINIVPSMRLLREHKPSRIDIFLASPIEEGESPNRPVNHLLDDLESTLMGTFGEVFLGDLKPFYEYVNKYKADVYVYAPEKESRSLMEEYGSLDFSPEVLETFYNYSKGIKALKIEPTFK